MEALVSRRGLAITVAMALLVGVPFLGKAFHIDDTFVLTVSAQILREPLRPFNAQINWSHDPLPIFERTKNPPLLSYYLAPFIAFFGHSEHALHGAMLPFLVMLATGAALLGRWFWVGEWWPMLFVMFSPVVVVSGNVMRDVPAAGLVTLGLALFVLGTDDDRWGLAAWGAFLLGLGTLTKYSSVALIPLLVLYPLLRRKARYALWALLPVGLLGLWCLQNWLSQGKLHIVRLMEQRAAKEQGFRATWVEKFWPGLTIIGSILFLLPVVVVAWVRRRVWMALPLVVAAGVAAWYGLNEHFDGLGLTGRADRIVLTIAKTRVGKIVAETEEKVTLEVPDKSTVGFPRARVARIVRHAPMVSWQYYLWATAGAALLAVAIVGGLAATVWKLARREEESADWVFVVAWAAAPFVFSVVFAPFQATRHMLPTLPPLAVLVLRLLGPRRKAVNVALIAMLVLQAGVAYLVAAADCEYADAHRQFARYAADKFHRPGQVVWFNGHWGWQQYALEEGFKHYATHGPQPQPGDILLDPSLVHHSRYAPGLRQRLKLVEKPKEYRSRLPVRTMDLEHSFFYSVMTRKPTPKRPAAARMPYYFTTDDTPLDACQVFRVQEPAKP